LSRVLLFEALTEAARCELFCMLAGSSEGSFSSVLKQLIALGVSPDSTSPRTGWSALMCAAACYGHPERVALLLSSGANVNFQTHDEKRTALYESCRCGNTEVVRLLLNHGTDSHLAPTRSGNTPLQAACLRGNFEVASLLLEHGADPLVRNSSNVSPMYSAIKSGSSDLVRALFDQLRLKHLDSVIAKVTIGPGRRAKLTPLATAIRWSKFQVTETLLELGADPNSPFKVNKKPFHLACYAAKLNGARSLKALAAHGAKFDVVDPELGLTPLLLAAQFGGSRACSQLLETPEVDLGKRGSHGESALELAFKRPSLNAARILLARCESSVADMSSLGGDNAPASLILAIAHAPQQAKAVRALELIFGSFSPTLEDIAPAVKHFCAHCNDRALEYLLDRYPTLCKDLPEELRAMVPAAAMSGNFALLRRLMEEPALDRHTVRLASQRLEQSYAGQACSSHAELADTLRVLQQKNTELSLIEERND